MSAGTPQLGSLAVQAPSLPPQIVHVSPSTCLNLSLFKDLLKEYRQLDDSITMRLNRANAVVRGSERESRSSGKGTVQDQACLNIWKELMSNWSNRTRLVEYCVNVVDQSLQDKALVAQDSQATPAEQRKAKAEAYSQEVLRDQIHRELTVETIVRRRSVDAFRSRCKYFEPPLNTEEEARQMWYSR